MLSVRLAPVVFEVNVTLPTVVLTPLPGPASSTVSSWFVPGRVTLSEVTAAGEVNGTDVPLIRVWELPWLTTTWPPAEVAFSVITKESLLPVPPVIVSARVTGLYTTDTLLSTTRSSRPSMVSVRRNDLLRRERRSRSMRRPLKVRVEGRRRESQVIAVAPELDGQTETRNMEPHPGMAIREKVAERAGVE